MLSTAAHPKPEEPIVEGRKEETSRGSQAFTSSGKEVTRTALCLGHQDVEKDSHGTKTRLRPVHAWCSGGN